MPPGWRFAAAIPCRRAQRVEVTGSVALIEINPAERAPKRILAMMAVVLLAAVGCKNQKGEGTVRVNLDAGHERPASMAATASEAAAGAAPVVAEDVSTRIRHELATAAKLDPQAAAKMNTVRPVLKCVEKVSDTEWRAHFGFNNPTPAPVTIPVGFYNRIWPPPISQQQPTVFPRGSAADVVQVKFNAASSTAWILGTSFQEAKVTSPPCAGPRKTGATVERERNGRKSHK